MTVIVLQVFVSLILVAGSIVMFVVSVRQGDHDHLDRLSLKPIEEEAPCTPSASNTTTR
jgi:hypothetical protein